MAKSYRKYHKKEAGVKGRNNLRNRWWPKVGRKHLLWISPILQTKVFRVVQQTLGYICSGKVVCGLYFKELLRLSEVVPWSSEIPGMNECHARWCMCNHCSLLHCTAGSKSLSWREPRNLLNYQSRCLVCSSFFCGPGTMRRKRMVGAVDVTGSGLGMVIVEALVKPAYQLFAARRLR